MKKLFLLICLCLYIKSYSKSLTRDSSFITYKDSAKGISFKYPAQWDSALSQIFHYETDTTSYRTTRFNARFPIVNNISLGGMGYYSFNVSPMVSLDFILENEKFAIKKDNPKAIIQAAKVIITKNKIKCVYVMVKNKIAEGVTTVKYIFTNKVTVFNFEFMVRTDDKDLYKKAFETVADSFQFDK